MAKVTYELTRCPVCDGLETDEIIDQDGIKREVELLWRFHEKRLHQGIPPEHLTDRLAFAQPPPLRLSQCRSCTHVYRNPWERKEALGLVYDAEPPGRAVWQTLFDTQRTTYRSQSRRLTAELGRVGRGLEVGSYVGGFLAAAREDGWAFEGVDLSGAACRFAAEQGLRVTHGTIEEIPPDLTFYVVGIWNTFEQMYDCRAALAAARRLLRGNGRLVVRVPNGRFYVRWRRRLAGATASLATVVLAHNNLLTFPYRQAFTRRSLTRLFTKAGFAITRVVGDTLVPIADRWTTAYGRWEERMVKGIQRVVERGWRAPWVEVYASPETLG